MSAFKKGDVVEAVGGLVPAGSRGVVSEVVPDFDRCWVDFGDEVNGTNRDPAAKAAFMLLMFGNVEPFDYHVPVMDHEVRLVLQEVK